MSEPEPEKDGGLEDYSLKKFVKTNVISLKTMSIAELLALRDEIDVLLPATSLKGFNLEQEVLLQYLRIKELQGKVALDDSVPSNQRAQVANSVAKLLGDITRMRNEVYNGEQARLMEAALARTLRALPKEAQEAFYEAYGKMAEEMASAGPQPIP